MNCFTLAQDTTRNFRDKFSKELDCLVKSFKYSDAFRVLHPHKVEFTFYRASCAPSRLDRVYLPPHITGKVLSSAHHPGLADHWGLEIVLDMDLDHQELPPRPPKTHWKLNSSILQHQSFLPQFSVLFRQLEQQIDKADWWDSYAKPAISSFLKTFSTSLAKQKKCFKSFLFALLRTATRREDWKLVSETKEKLEIIIKNESFGLIVLSREGQNPEEEVASIYHS